MTESPGTLKSDEFHPSAHIANRFIISYISKHNGYLLHESLASCALSGNRSAELCSETLRRLLDREPVSDRYLMGLAWFLWEMGELEDDEC